MSTKEEIAELEKEVAKARFTLAKKSGELHDLIEDRLPTDYKEIPAYAEAAFAAGKAWDELNTRLIEMKNRG